MIRIFSFITDPFVLSIVAQVSRRWNRYLADNQLWQLICRGQKFGPISKVTLRLGETEYPLTHPNQLGTVESHQNEIVLKSYYEKQARAKIYRLASRRLLSHWKKVYMQNHITSRNWRQGTYTVSRLNQGQLDGHLTVQFDDKYAISLSANTGRFWKLKTGDLVLSLESPLGRITSSHFADGVIITGLSNGHVNVWSIASKSILSTLTGHLSEVGAVNMHNEWIASGSEDCSIRVC